MNFLNMIVYNRSAVRDFQISAVPAILPPFFTSTTNVISYAFFTGRGNRFNHVTRATPRRGSLTGHRLRAPYLALTT